MVGASFSICILLNSLCTLSRSTFNVTACLFNVHNSPLTLLKLTMIFFDESSSDLLISCINDCNLRTVSDANLSLSSFRLNDSLIQLTGSKS